MSDLKDSGDVTIRFKTDIKSGDSLFTDLNGHTIQHRKFKEKLHTQGNFFPMPSTAFIQDSSTRLSILGSEPHGVASLAEGEIEPTSQCFSADDYLQSTDCAVHRLL